MTEENAGLTDATESTEENKSTESTESTETKGLTETAPPEETKDGDTEGHREKEYDTRGKEEKPADAKVDTPDGIDESWWDADKGTLVTDKVISELESRDKQIKDFRRIVSKGTKAPEKAEDYNIALEDDVEALGIREEVVESMKNQAHKLGLSEQQLNGMINGYFNDLIDKDLIDKPMSDEEAKAKHEKFLSDEKSKLGDNADNIIRGVVNFANTHLKSGALNEAERDIIIKIADQGADHIRVLDKLRQLSGEQPIPVTNAEVSGLPSDEEIGREWSKYSEKEKEEMMEKRIKAGRPLYMNFS